VWTINPQVGSEQPQWSMVKIIQPVICLIIILTFNLPPPLLGAASPAFIFEAPESLEPLVLQLKRINTTAIERIIDLMGLAHAGPSIRVILAPDNSPPAQGTPEWMVGYALSESSTIVLLTDRVLTYPNNSLNDVFLHEIGHILVHRAAGGQPLPRWFDEGLAMMAARTWDLEDRARLVWAMVSSTEPSLEELNALFLKDATSVRQAYVLSYAFTLDLLEQAQPNIPKRILEKVKQGLAFGDAFFQTTGLSLAQAQEEFWSRQTLWNRWIPVATSSAALWLTITFLAFWAYTKQRRRAAAIKQQWQEDDWDV